MHISFMVAFGGFLIVFSQNNAALGQAVKSGGAFDKEAPLYGSSYNTCWGPEKMPELPGGGGNAAIVQAIQNQIVYPQTALRENIQGRVFISFMVQDDGSIQNARIVKGIGGGCDEAVLAAVQQLPRFIPAKQSGRSVPAAFTLPVTFKIPTPVPLKRNH